MSRMLKMDTAALALALLFLAASPAAAQIQRLEATRVPAERPPRPATLGCCKCLGGTNTLDLSTIPSNAWTVSNGSPVAYPTATHPAWNVNPGPAKWVSTVASGGTGSVPAGTYEYRLDFLVPACTIGQEVTLSGNVGGDDDFDVFLDSAAGTPLTSCAGWCFNTQKPLQTFTTPVTPTPPGLHTLIVRIKNGGGPSGMFVNATLTGACRRE